MIAIERTYDPLRGRRKLVLLYSTDRGFGLGPILVRKSCDYWGVTEQITTLAVRILTIAVCRLCHIQVRGVKEPVHHSGIKCEIRISR